MMKLSFSAVSHIGELCKVNDDKIYANGKFTGSGEMDNVQLSFEDSGEQFIFAVSEAMESEEEVNSPEISVTEEILKFQQKARSSIKNIENKVEEMSDCIGQVNNLLYSMTIGDPSKKGIKPSFAGLIIDNSRAAALNLGNCRIYKLEPDNLMPLAGDYKRTERLRKMGIITDEQAEILSGQLGVKNNSLSPVKRSEIFRLEERDVILICSNGLTEAVTEDAIYGILSSNGDTDELAGLLVKEAVKNGAKDNVTAAVIKALSVDAESEASKSSSQSISGQLSRLAGAVGTKKTNKTKIISTAVLCVVIAAVLFGTYSLFMSLRPHSRGNDALAQSESSSTAGSLDENSSDAAGSQAEGSTADEQTQESSTETGDAADSSSTDGKTTTYKIQKGDSLYTISKKFYGDTQKYNIIMEANNLKDPNKISEGQELKIPEMK